MIRSWHYAEIAPRKQWRASTEYTRHQRLVFLCQSSIGIHTLWLKISMGKPTSASETAGHGDRWPALSGRGPVFGLWGRGQIGHPPAKQVQDGVAGYGQSLYMVGCWYREISLWVVLGDQESSCWGVSKVSCLKNLAPNERRASCAKPVHVPGPAWLAVGSDTLASNAPHCAAWSD